MEKTIRIDIRNNDIYNMRNVKSFVSFLNEDIMPRYSGGDVTKMKVIGEIITEPMHGEAPKKYNVVEIIPAGNNDNCIYVINKWYKSNTPQLIHSAMVSRFTPEWEKIK
jgi:hypothetical protein